MLSLPSEINTQCFQLLARCKEFTSREVLRASFVTIKLGPFRDRLPASTGNTETFVNLVKAFLLETRLADGRVLLLPFLETLRGQYPPEDGLHGEIGQLYQRVIALPDAITSAPVALNRHYICYAPQDGAGYADRLAAALQ
jgi:hypothetical protein